MLEKIKAYVEKYQMIACKDRIIVGLSGGPDSVCLFFVLLKLCREYSAELFAVHVNHELRPETAGRDQQFVENLCAAHDVPLDIVREDVREYAQREHIGEEEAGRLVRIKAFERAMEGHRADKIALGHNRDDNAETLLYNLCRGSDLRGLGGIAPVEGRRIRPLLGIGKAEIMDWLDKMQIEYCLDETNTQDKYARNRLRNHVLPFLEKNTNARASEHMARAAESLRIIQGYLDRQVETEIKRCVKLNSDQEAVLLAPMFQNVCGELKGYVLYEVLCRVSGKRKDISQTHVDLLEDLFNRQNGKRLCFPYGVHAERVYEGIRLYSGNLPKTDTGEEQNGEDLFEVTYAEGDKIPGSFDENPYTKWFDYDIIKNTVEFRHPREGDFITINRNGDRQTLRRFFINRKVPGEERKKIWLAADEDEIMWIVGYRQNQRYQITDRTKRAIKIKYEEDKNMAGTIRVMIEEEAVSARIKELGKQISKDYDGKELHLICVLKGGVFFTVELAKRIECPVSLDFMCVSSYGDDTSSSGIVKIIKDLDESLEGKDVLVVEDIVDSGRTLSYLLDILSKRNPKSMKLCTLLDKPTRRVKEVTVDYIGFEIPDEFVIGCGLDYLQKYRNLPYIGVLEGIE